MNASTEELKAAGDLLTTRVIKNSTNNPLIMWMCEYENDLPERHYGHRTGDEFQVNAPNIVDASLYAVWWLEELKGKMVADGHTPPNYRITRVSLHKYEEWPSS